MPSPSTRELKAALVDAGFEVFRVRASRIYLADRVRDNLIMDSAVSVVAASPLIIRFVVRAEANQFPGETEEQLFDRARTHARKSLDRGYTEVETAVVPITNPGDRKSRLDTWYEVSYEKRVTEEELHEELRYALGLEKTVPAG